jgi:hypothetical protein
MTADLTDKHAPLLGLKNFMPYAYTPIVLIVVGGLLTTLGALLGPETRNVGDRIAP